MTLTIDVNQNAVLSDLLGLLSPKARKELHAVAAENLAHLIQLHLRQFVFSKHVTAQKLGAQPTRHYEKGTAAISTHATASKGTVTIPIPGIQRAFHDVTITAKVAQALTLPVDALAYGRRVSEVKALGWQIFRPKDKASGTLRDCLLGTKNGETKVLYVLKRVVRQPRDPSLLPAQEAMSQTAIDAMIRCVNTIVEQARRKNA